MSSTADIKAQLDILVGEATGFAMLAHLLRIEKNSFSEGGKFGVLPRGSREIPGNTLNITKDFVFSVILTDTYISASVSDSAILGKMIALTDKFEAIYTKIAKTKCNLPSVVLGVSTFDVFEAILVEEEKTIIVEGNLTIKVRISL